MKSINNHPNLILLFHNKMESTKCTLHQHPLKEIQDLEELVHLLEKIRIKEEIEEVIGNKTNSRVVERMEVKE
jgi:hypothetical protein